MLFFYWLSLPIWSFIDVCDLIAISIAFYLFILVYIVSYLFIVPYIDSHAFSKGEGGGEGEGEEGEGNRRGAEGTQYRPKVYGGSGHY